MTTGLDVPRTRHLQLATAAVPPSRPRRLRRHWHVYRWRAVDPFRSPSLYSCRCGIVRPGL